MIRKELMYCFHCFQIGLVMAIQAGVTSTCQAVLFAPIQRRLGTIGTFRAAVPFYVLGYLMYPIEAAVAAKENASGNGVKWTWLCLGIQICCMSLANIVRVEQK